MFNQHAGAGFSFLQLQGVDVFIFKLDDALLRKMTNRIVNVGYFDAADGGNKLPDVVKVDWCAILGKVGIQDRFINLGIDMSDKLCLILPSNSGHGTK
ncbi:hypothetical protein LNQ45_13115 [Yersinia ruckeri]|nr:hypothetical protein [Yersinia ruckeri]MCK8565651.1 hypothetical protein [Yersinia ruckeri]MCK8584568.1 hypothetical protein [Yersinia ruckeri]UZY18000.1 hypothetical protein LNQ24_014065 [Yersinia ruckeri]